jgi:hypothetical protein
MAFQPDANAYGLYLIPSNLQLAGEFFSVDGLTEDPAGTGLYAFDVGDYAYPVQTPSPHVEMTLFELDDDCVTISLFRTVGRRTMPVRGMDHVYAIGGVNVVDWEAPAGIDLTYWAEQYNADGEFIATTNPSTTRLDFEGTWVHNPLDPAGAVHVRLGRGAASKIPRGQDSELAWFDGSGIATAVTGQRHGVTDTPITFYTLTDADSDKVNEMLGDPYNGPSGPMILCIRPGTGENTRWPKPFFALVDLEEQPVTQPSGGQVTRWEGTGTEVEPPAVVLVAPVLTYDDFAAFYATYDDIEAAYGTYLEMERDYRLAGYADSHPGNGQSGPTDPTPPPTPTDPTVPTTPDGPDYSGRYGAGIYGS